MAFVGYARVSSVGQTLSVQLDKLKHCDKIFRERKSSASGKRLRLDACLENVREGDTLVVSRLDRLARSTFHLCQIAAEVERKKVNLQVLDQNVNTLQRIELPSLTSPQPTAKDSACPQTRVPLAE